MTAWLELAMATARPCRCGRRDSSQARGNLATNRQPTIHFSSDGGSGALDPNPFQHSEHLFGLQIWSYHGVVPPKSFPILVGTCSWLDHKGFYPAEMEKQSQAKQRLTYYAEFFPIVEVDTTFYGRPKPEVTQAWVDRTPPGFTFDVKAYRSLTRHERGPDNVPRPPTHEEEHEFLELLKPLRDAHKLGAIEYQFPPWFTRSVKNQEILLEVRERHPADLLAFEFRHRSWYDEDALPQLEELMRELGVTFVAADAPQIGSGTVPPYFGITSSLLNIVRFHGRNTKTWYIRGADSTARFDYLYHSTEVEPWVAAIHAAAKHSPVHVLINTNRDNQGPINAYRIADALGVSLPTAPFDFKADN